MTDTATHAVAARLARAGFVGAVEQAEALVAHADGDSTLLDDMVARRLTGEPLAWIVGSIEFMGERVQVRPGVYVPRPHTEEVARRAIDRLPPDGVAIDVCTGTGAVAVALRARRPAARVVGTDLSEAAVRCAQANEIDAVVGDLLEPVPATLVGAVDVVVGVVPYVPTESLHLLHRDALHFEPAAAFDGGPGGHHLLRRVVAEAALFLRPGGALVLELGGDQAQVITADLHRHGFELVDVMCDEDGDVRGIEATLVGDRPRLS